jgi:hypothetical protein
MGAQFREAPVEPPGRPDTSHHHNRQPLSHPAQPLAAARVVRVRWLRAAPPHMPTHRQHAVEGRSQQRVTTKMLRGNKRHCAWKLHRPRGLLQ